MKKNSNSSKLAHFPTCLFALFMVFVLGTSAVADPLKVDIVTSSMWTADPKADDAYLNAVSDGALADGFVTATGDKLCHAKASLSDSKKGDYYWYFVNVSYSTSVDVTPLYIYDIHDGDGGYNNLVQEPSFCLLFDSASGPRPARINGQYA